MSLFTSRDWREPYRRLSDQALLDYIKADDSLAQQYLWLTYHDVVLNHMKAKLNQYGNLEQLGKPGDFVRDAILLLLEKSERLGAAVLHQRSTIKSWLLNTAFNFLRNAIRRNQHLDRTEWTNPDEDGVLRSAVDELRDEGAESFSEVFGQEPYCTIQRVLASLPPELQTLVQTKFMEGSSWKETSVLMLHRYPNHKPPFELSYLQQTYWDRVHKKAFVKRLRNALNA